MHLLVALTASFAVSALAHSSHEWGHHDSHEKHGDHHRRPCPYGDCLKSCRSCPTLHNDGEGDLALGSPFQIGCRQKGDCKELKCKDPKAVLIVDGRSYDSLVCFQGQWHFGFPYFLETTNSARCEAPPADVTCDSDATVTRVNEEWVCQCRPGFVDVSDAFGLDGPGQACSRCSNKKLNVMFLLDISGSQTDYYSGVKAFTEAFSKFANVSAGNNVSIMSIASTFTTVLPPSTCTTQACVDTAIGTIPAAGGVTRISTGLEALKAIYLQPVTISEFQDVAVVVTDGTFVRNPDFSDVINAANNLDKINVEIYAIGTTANHAANLEYIVNGYSDAILTAEDTDDLSFNIANKLQKLVCAL